MATMAGMKRTADPHGRTVSSTISRWARASQYDVIGYAVWPYYRFPVCPRIVEDAERPWHRSDLRAGATLVG